MRTPPRLIGQVAVPVPDPARWREQLISTLTDLHTVLASHRGDAALAGLGRVPTTPHALRGAEALVAVMRAGGLNDEVAALGLEVLIAGLEALSARPRPAA
jgi:hypothetical protein